MTNKKHTKKNYLKDAVERITMMLFFISLAAVVAWFILVSMKIDFADDCIWINNSGQCLRIFFDNGNKFCVGDTICNAIM